MCLPDFETDKTPNDGKPAVDLGLATTIVEESLADPNSTHTVLGRSRMCIADLGVNCTAAEQYTPFQFTSAKPVKLVFRISSDAIAALYKNNQTISRRSRRSSTTEWRCLSARARSRRAATRRSRRPGRVQNKFWVIEAQAPGNGLWGW